LSKISSIVRFLPILNWGSRYNKDTFTEDGVAAIVVAIILIPQSLAYALLAGMPAETGLYASIFGLTIYALFGTSNTLSVAPVAVISLMTAVALDRLSLGSEDEYIAAAVVLAFTSGLVLLIFGFLRLGFMANFLSHPVISAFITASALIIGLSQVQHFLGVEVSGTNIIELSTALMLSVSKTNLVTLTLGICALLLIIWSKKALGKGLIALGLKPHIATIFSKSGPLLVAFITSCLTYFLSLDQQDVQILGYVEGGFPTIHPPEFSPELIESLLGSAILISIIAFVESVSVAQSLAARRRESIELNQELIGLGAANLGASFGGGFPIAGGFSRSVVNFEAGAATPASGLIAALLIMIVTLFFAPILYWLPKVCLAAIIVVAIYSLIDFSVLKRSWIYSKADFAAVFLTLIITLTVGVEAGIAAGVGSSILIHLYKTSQPHIAVIGRVKGTEHFRNVNRHKVETFEELLSIRIDESLYFANSRYLEEFIFNLVAQRPELKHVILMCTAINTIDLSALESLEKIANTLHVAGIKLHLSEVKGPIMDKLAATDFFNHLSGNNYLSHNQAVEDLRKSEPLYSEPKTHL